MEKRRELWIRADANKEIGMGHMMRCLTIAEAAKKKGIRTLFFTADEEGAGLLQERQQDYRVLHTDYRSLESELPELFSIVRKEAGLPLAEKLTDIVFLVDSYQITESYMRALRQELSMLKIRLALMEDYGDVPYQTDILINYNIYGIDFSYEKNAPKTLLGCTYMPLRQPFKEQKYRVREKAEHLLITTGGSDSYRIAEALVEKLTEQTTMYLYVVCGRFSDSLEALRSMERASHSGGIGTDFKKEDSRSGRIKVYTDVKKMWELMAECDIAISAAGTTLYELCAIGVPTICFSFADNQILPGTAFEKYTPVYYAGDYEKDKTVMFTNIMEKVKQLGETGKAGREEISRQMQEIVDGNGAERIVTKLWE